MSNQYDWVFSLLFTTSMNMSNQISPIHDYTWLQKTFLTKTNFFPTMLFSFSSLLLVNKESIGQVSLTQSEWLMRMNKPGLIYKVTLLLCKYTKFKNHTNPNFSSDTNRAESCHNWPADYQHFKAMVRLGDQFF